MAEYIGCRNCESFYCDNCNIYILATMLNEGKLDCLMDERHCITIDPMSYSQEKEWVSVEDRLPERGQEVIVFTGNKRLSIVRASTFWSDQYDSWLGVSHWMPLPEPPDCGANTR